MSLASFKTSWLWLGRGLDDLQQMPQRDWSIGLASTNRWTVAHLYMPVSFFIWFYLVWLVKSFHLCFSMCYLLGIGIEKIVTFRRVRSWRMQRKPLQHEPSRQTMQKQCKKCNRVHHYRFQSTTTNGTNWRALLFIF